MCWQSSDSGRAGSEANSIAPQSHFRDFAADDDEAVRTLKYPWLWAAEGQQPAGEVSEWAVRVGEAAGWVSNEGHVTL